ncbi:MAG: M16 family metallopeptidase [Pikeienuella sp.]
MIRITAIVAPLLALMLVALPARAVDVVEATSPGGTTFWMVSEPSIPIVAIEMTFKGGARLDPADRPGLSRITAALLDEGAGELDAAAFAKRKDDLAARFSISVGRDGTRVSAQMLVETAQASAELIAQALGQPRFDDDAIERVRSQLLSALREQETQPGSVAGKAWSARAFPDHPYGRPTDGTLESVAAITRDEILAAHQRLLTTANLYVSVVGAVDADTAGRLIDTLLADIPEGTALSDPEPAPIPAPGLEILDLDVPQSVAIFGQRGIARDDPDFFPAYVMNHILGGGGFSARLMTEVREKRGLAYSVYSYLSERDAIPLLLGSVQTENARMAESISVIRDEWARLASDGVSDTELENAKRYLTGSFPLSLDSNAKIARFLLTMQEEDLGIDYLDRRNGYVEAVTSADISRVAAELLDAEELAIVVVGRPAGL